MWRHHEANDVKASGKGISQHYKLAKFYFRNPQRMSPPPYPDCPCHLAQPLDKFHRNHPHFKIISLTFSDNLLLVLWHCWMGVKKSIWPVKIEWRGVGVVICLEQGVECLRMAQLMLLHPRTLSSLASFKSRLSGTSLCRLSWKRGCYMGVVLVVVHSKTNNPVNNSY